MTTLVMAGILLVGVIGFRQLPVSDLPNVDYPTIKFRRPARRESGNDGVGGRDPTGKTILHHPGVDSMSSSARWELRNITMQFSLDRNIDAAAQDVKAAIARRRTTAAELADAADVPKSQSGGFADFFPRHVVATLPISTWTITRKISWPSKFRRSPVLRKSTCSARSNTPCGFRWTRTSWRLTAWALIRSSRRS